METNIFLNAFIEKFNSRKMLLSVTTFSELYDEIITESYQLQKEINESLLSLHPDNKELYLNYVKDLFIKENGDLSLLGKLIKICILFIIIKIIICFIQRFIKKTL